MLLRNSPNKHVPMYSVTWSWRNINISVIANKDPPCTSQQTSLLSSSSSSTTSSLSSLLQPAKAASCSPFLRLRPGRNGRRIMITTCPFFCPSVRSSVTKLVNTIFRKRMNRVWCPLAQVFHGARTWNDHLWGSGGQRSRSHEAEDRGGGLAEALSSTALCRVSFLVFTETLL